jgi:hypothetical protein
MISLVENCGIRRKVVIGFRLKCEKCGAEEVEIINHRACEMTEACGNNTVELHCLACDSTAILVE